MEPEVKAKLVQLVGSTSIDTGAAQGLSRNLAVTWAPGSGWKPAGHGRERLGLDVLARLLIPFSLRRWLDGIIHTGSSYRV